MVGEAGEGFASLASGGGGASDGILRDGRDQLEVGLDAGEDLGGEGGLVLREPREAPARPRARRLSAERVRRRRLGTHVSSECSTWSLTSPIQSGMPLSVATT